jgi:hypothetical protein
MEKTQVLDELKAELKHAQEIYKALAEERNEIAVVMTAASRRLDSARGALEDLQRESQRKGLEPNPGLGLLIHARIQALTDEVQSYRDALSESQEENDAAARRYDFMKTQLRIAEFLI